MIRGATRADLARLIDAVLLLNANGEAVDPRYRLGPHAQRDLRPLLSAQWFDSFLPFPACLIAEADGEFAGFVSAQVVQPHPILAQAPSMCIDSLWIEPAHRRKGLARRLVGELRRRATAGGFPRHTVSTLCADEQAVAFWEAVGFAPFTVTLEANA